MLLFSNGIIHTVDPSLSNPEAVLVGDDGRIAALGTRAALERPRARHVDLAGRTLIPGFNDAHVHVSWLGMLLTSLVDTRIHVAPNIPSIVDRLAERAQSQPVGSWVEGVGYNEAQHPVSLPGSGIAPATHVLLCKQGSDAYVQVERTSSTSLPCRWRPSLTRCASAASASL
jgi:predicted amidohydrolase YtcJ